MAILAELFAARRADASSYAQARSTGAVPTARPDAVDVTGLTDLDVETLGELATAALHVRGVGCELDYSDVERDDLYVVPSEVVRALAQLPDVDDTEVPEGENDMLSLVARQWAATEELESTVDVVLPLVRRIVDLAIAAERANLEVFYWSEVSDGLA